MTNMSCKAYVSILVESVERCNVKSAYRDKTGNAGPERVVWQLPPASLMHDGALIYTTTDNVYYHSNQGDDAKYTAGAELLFGNLDSSAGSRRAGLEDVGATVGRSDKGDGVERS